MSDRSAIYAASPEDSAEVQRVLRICLSGMRPPAALTYEGGDFPVWVRQKFFPVVAPHAVTVHDMARRGDAAALTVADAALQFIPASALAGRDLLAQRAGARHFPVMRRFAAAVAEGKAAGHFVTVFALCAADFSVALLPLLQCLLFCEWRAGQPAGAVATMDDFFRNAAGVLPFLPSLLTSHSVHSANSPSLQVRQTGRLKKSPG